MTFSKPFDSVLWFPICSNGYIITTCIQGVSDILEWTLSCPSPTTALYHVCKSTLDWHALVYLCFLESHSEKLFSLWIMLTSQAAVMLILRRYDLTCSSDMLLKLCCLIFLGLPTSITLPGQLCRALTR